MFTKSTTKPTIEVLEQCVPNVIISKEAMIKMELIINECSEEVGWLGTAYKEKNTIIISDVIIFKQQVHSTTTEITPEGLNDFGQEILQKPNGVELWNSIKVWGHSHVNMAVFASGQDDKQMVVFKDNGLDWFVRIIANKKGDIKIDLYDYESAIIYYNIPWEIAITQEEYNIKQQIKLLEEKLDTFNDELRGLYTQMIKKEISEKVSKLTSFTTQTYKKISQYGYHQWYNPNGYDDKDDIDEDYYSQWNKRTNVKKNIEEEKKENEKELYDDYIIDDMIECQNIKDVREVLTLWGYDEEIYTDEEIRIIWEKAFASAIKDREATIRIN